MKYVPLHLHTEYSLLDGGIKLKELFQFAKENDMPAVALTDHGTMYGVIDFYLNSKNIEGVKPLIGCEFYICDGDVKNDKETKKTMYHLVLIAKNNQGYQNLIKMASIAAVECFYYKPRINHEILEKYHEGLICLSACIQGEVAKNILDGDEDKALECAKWYKNLFGEDYYIELQDHNLIEQKRSNPKLINIARELDIEMVITNDSHYLRSEDASWHDTLLCEQTKSSKSDQNRFRFSNNEFYVKTVDELRQAFSWMEESVFNRCIENTVKAAEKCDVEIDLGKSHLPSYPVPEGFTTETYFDHLVREGLNKRYGKITPEIEERYTYEKNIIIEMGFPAYFLITWDFINWAKKSKIPVGPGRGSAAGSMVAYALEITDIDPIRHNLLFERFLNPERVSMPDVDIDFCKRRRSEVIDYVTQKYGEDHVCQIITFGTLAARAAVKAVCRVYDVDFTESNKYSAMIPSTPGTKLDEALRDGMELKKVCNENPQVKGMVEEARQIEGLKNQVGTHAAGVIISHKPLDEIIPIALSKEKAVTTQYAMSDIEKLGLLKMDFLGLETLTIIQDALDLIKLRHGVNIEINNIPLDDPKTFALLQKGYTDGVFQLESSGMKKLVKELKPTVFEDLGALVALFRPGPLNSGMVEEFVECKHGRKQIKYPHPSLEPILKDTYGTMVYQEQIMQIAQKIANYTLGQADILRRAMGKKKIDEMQKQRAIFVSGASANGIDERISNDLFDNMMKFAEYGFNRSHSAAYAFVAYQTAYLKAHYPVEFMCSTLSSQAGNQEKTQQYIAQCEDLGIQVLAPDINKSSSEFYPDEDNIRFGLASIKNVGQAVIEEVEKERENGVFESFYDFCRRVDSKCLNKKTLESLIKAGAFSGIEKSRKQLLMNIDHVVSYVQKANKDKERGQVSLFAGLEEASDLSIPTCELLGDSSEEFTDTDIQQFEKELMGIYVTSHPLSSIKDTLKYLTTDTINEIMEAPLNDREVTICGLLSKVVQKPTRRDPAKFIKTGHIEDLMGKIEFVAFPKIVEALGAMIREDQKVIMSAKVQNREEEINLIVQDVKPIQNVNLVTIKLLEDLAFEENEYLKELMVKYGGDDPVVIDYKDEDGQRRELLVGKKIWVNYSNDMHQEMNRAFGDKLQILVRELN